MPENTCRCGCGEQVTRNYAPGHALRHASRLRQLAVNGDLNARREMYERGWHWERTASPGARAFGFEAEFFGMSHWDAVSALRSSGIVAEDDGYHHDAKPYWRVTEDGSVSGEGCELVSPILNSRLKPDIEQGRKALNVLRLSGGQVNRTCGLHIHHNLRGKTALDVAETAAHWALFQPIINRVLPSSRHDGEYCAGMHGPESWHLGILNHARGSRAVEVDGMRFGRYHAINLNAINQHGTLEYRQHSGTLNGDKLEHWVIFTRAMHDVSRIGGYRMLMDLYGGADALRREMGVDDMLRYLGVPKRTRAFYAQREASLSSIGDDEGANDWDESDAGYYDGEYDEHGGIWCSNCQEYHYDE